MNLKRTLTIFRKETRDVLRDRRTLLVMIVLPIILYPTMMILMTQVMLTQAKKLEEKSAKVVIQGAAYSPIVMEELSKISILTVVQVDSPLAALQERDIQMVMEIPQGFDDELGVGTTANLKLYYDQANEQSSLIQRKVTAILDSLETDLAQKRLQDRGIDPNIIHPIEVETVNVASESRMAAFAFGGTLAMILTLMAMLGAFYPSIDLTAGEKERGTMETLLVSPASRVDIVMGKFLTVLTISVITALLNLLSLGFSLGFIVHLAAESLPFQFSISPWSLLLILLLLIPVAVLFSAICMAIASFTRSFKEGQNLLTPVNILTAFLGMVAMLPGIELTPAVAIIPVANVALLIKKILLGEANLPMILLVFASIAAAAWISIRWAVSQFQREDILFLEGEQIKWSSLFRRRLAPTRAEVPGMSMAWVAYLVSLLLLFYIGQAEQAKNLTRGLLITELFLVAGPPIILTRHLRYNIRKTFQLNQLKVVPGIMTILAAVSAWVIVIEVSAIQNQIFPYPQSFLDAFEDIFKVFQARGVGYSLMMMAILPAVCEETLFRGFIMTGFRRQWGATRAVILTAVIFGLFHLSPYRYLPTGLLGLLIGGVVVWTGSLWSGMLAHFVANASSALVFQLTYQSTNPTLVSLREGTHLPVWLIIVAVVVMVVSIRSLFLYYRRSFSTAGSHPYKSVQDPAEQ